MNKKANTVIFILGATVVNVLIMLGIFIILFILYGRFIAPGLSPEINQIVMLLLFIGSIVLTYFIYNKLIKYVSNKYDLDKYFDPIFKQKKK
jgi:membrane protein implicated in regulation of membrane protease activity